MKTRLVLVFSLTIVFALPCFANDPSMTGGGGSNTNMNSGGGRQMSPGRDQWTRRRIKQLRRQM
ncbi:MAG TPA: hypothetical protein VJ719_03960, partial [Chthoniobacterales bacterium]|nr:hypothetical protein [Chthoniobacterales bacterium]